MAWNPLNEDGARSVVTAWEGGRYTDTAFASDSRPDVHVHVLRIGDEGAGLAGRVAVAAHGPNGEAAVYVAADEARAVAAAILNAADELDGVTPLTYTADAPETDEPGGWAALEIDEAADFDAYPGADELVGETLHIIRAGDDTLHCLDLGDVVVVVDHGGITGPDGEPFYLVRRVADGVAQIVQWRDLSDPEEPHGDGVPA